MATDTKMRTARKHPAYLVAMPVVVASMMNPTAAIRDIAAENGPLIPNLSAAQAVRIIMMKQKAYGGADIPFDWMIVNVPISEMMVGRKRGNEANDTAQPKYMSDGIQLLGSMRASGTSRHLTPVLFSSTL